MNVDDYDNGHDIHEDNLGYIQKRSDSSKVKSFATQFSLGKTLLDITGSFPAQDSDKRLLGPEGREKMQPAPCETA